MSLPMLLGTINFIYAKNFEASCKFYGETLALPVAGRIGDNVTIFALPGAYLGVVAQGVSAAANPPRCAAEAGDTVIVGLVCQSEADVDSYHRRLANASCGCKVEAAPKRNEQFGLYNMLARDPNGYLVEVQAFLKPFLTSPPPARL
eukprot:TRINITY_DN40729_c0_g1_i1.p2 TRINITY_DN40729_c0_g1~~TRINITY_DN40729_c0_g1_i1.p2  ORF type:complete len:147 (+),score=19.48 TRINITY_DN40729_c0_g1_i1:64-504(+)